LHFTVPRIEQQVAGKQPGLQEAPSFVKMTTPLYTAATASARVTR